MVVILQNVFMFWHSAYMYEKMCCNKLDISYLRRKCCIFAMTKSKVISRGGKGGGGYFPVLNTSVLGMFCYCYQWYCDIIMLSLSRIIIISYFYPLCSLLALLLVPVFASSCKEFALRLQQDDAYKISTSSKTKFYLVITYCSIDFLWYDFKQLTHLSAVLFLHSMEQKWLPPVSMHSPKHV